MDIASLEDLPSEVLFRIIADWPLSEITQLCEISQTLDQKICQLDEFWKQRYQKDFGPLTEQHLIWREAYHQRLNNQVYVLDMVQQELRTINLRGIREISAGYDRGLILLEDGTVYEYFESLQGLEFVDINIRSMSSGHKDLFLTDTNLVYYNNEEAGYVPYPRLLGIVSVSAGQDYNLFLNKYGGVFWERNSKDPIDRIPQKFGKIPKIKAISAGKSHLLLLTREGQVLFVEKNREKDREKNREGEDSVTNKLTTPVPISGLPEIQAVSAGSDTSLFLDGDGKVYILNHVISETLNPEQIPDLPPIQAISTRAGHHLLLAENPIDEDTGEHVLYFYKDPQNIILLPGLVGVTEISAGMDGGLVIMSAPTLYSTVQTLLDNDWVTSFKEIEKLEDGNSQIQLTDLTGEHYLAEVRYDRTNNEIYPPR